MTADPLAVQSDDAREYPAAPAVGVGAIIVIDEGRIVLVRRARAPLAGEWSLPGGRVELGEPLADALRREVREETGLDVVVGPLVCTLDRIHRDEDGGVRYHYVLLDYVCRPSGGTLRAGSDAADVVIARASDLDRYEVAPVTCRVIADALTLANTHVWG